MFNLNAVKKTTVKRLHVLNRCALLTRVDFEGGEGDEAEDGHVGFFVAYGEAAVLLNCAGEAFDASALTAIDQR